MPASYLQLEDTVRNIALAMRAKRKPPVLTYKELRWVMVRCWAGYHVLHVSLFPSSTVILPLHTTVMLPLHTTVMSPSTPLSHRPSSTPSTFAGIGFLLTLAPLSARTQRTESWNKLLGSSMITGLCFTTKILFSITCTLLTLSGWLTCWLMW